VSGFAKILENEYGDRLDEEAKRLMVIIRSNSEQMGKLIDDLLAFFRMGRKDLVKVIVNTSQLVASVIKEIETYIPEGQQPVRWDVAALPDVYADPASLRQVWANLIGNAVKYSKKEQDPFVQIGTYREGPQTVFFVKDNGVGFDEKYSEKLFKVFQRLHSAQDFDGTGVGLAIAEKVISKHGGNIWARSEPGKGASFYFSLPDQ
jgi:light-regulated signal transduction histidine kinase (bacteriophytochrome)